MLVTDVFWLSGSCEQITTGAPGVRGRVLLELLQSLPSQISPVYQKQYPPGSCVLDEPVGEANRRERLAASGSHLDERARPVLGESARAPLFPRPGTPADRL